MAFRSLPFEIRMLIAQLLGPELIQVVGDELIQNRIWGGIVIVSGCDHMGWRYSKYRIHPAQWRDNGMESAREQQLAIYKYKKALWGAFMLPTEYLVHMGYYFSPCQIKNTPAILNKIQ